MKLLVTGGAGYVGSVTVRRLMNAGYEVAVLDNLEQGHIQAVPKKVKFIEADLRRLDEVDRAFESAGDIDAVMHFAAYALAGESVQKPHAYYQNNVGGTANLLNAMIDNGIDKIVFSSTCATYGQPQKLPVDESHPLAPESPYGHSKLLIEEMLQELAARGKLSSIRLRYFNAAGALADIGEYHQPESHIIPLVVESALTNCGFILFGNNYNTPDGTCIRDYIHVIDLADAHIKALEKFQSGEINGTDVFNLGVGRGYSNQEIIDKVKEVSRKDFEVKIGPRRAGDPAQIYADNSKAKKVLGWEPRYGLGEIVESAWKWHSTHPQGYEST